MTESSKPDQAATDAFVDEKSLELLPQLQQQEVLKTVDNIYQSKENSRKRALQNKNEKKETVQENDGAVEENMTLKKRRKTEKRTIPSIRFNPSLGHFPSIEKSGLVRCKYEGCPKKDSKSYVLCSTCGVHLCFCVESNRNCFAAYHSIPK